MSYSQARRPLPASGAAAMTGSPPYSSDPRRGSGESTGNVYGRRDGIAPDYVDSGGPGYSGGSYDDGRSGRGRAYRQDDGYEPVRGSSRPLRSAREDRRDVRGAGGDRRSAAYGSVADDAASRSGAVVRSSQARRSGRSGRSVGSGRAESPPSRSRRRDPMWARLLVISGALLMLASGGVIIGAKALIANVTNSVEKAPLLGAAGATGGAEALKGALNILMVGVDERPDGKDSVRADSIMILHVPESHDQAYLTSIPRDAYVDIPAYKKTGYRGGKEKINAAFQHGWENGGDREGGFELLALTVNRITGMTFNAGAIVDFSGFTAVVDALGGVDMCVDTDVKSAHWGFDKQGKYLHPDQGGTPMVYHKGECRTFKGWEALDYVRQRYNLPNGDYDRQRHQQQFVKALAAKAKQQNLQSNPGRLLEITKSVGKTLTVDLRGHSVESWLFTLKEMTQNDVVMLRANAGNFNSVNCHGESCEVLSAETIDMLKALKDDTIAQFVINHPEFVSK